MAKDHGSSIKDDERYEALRDEGMSKEKAARIANSDPHTTGKKRGILKSTKIGPKRNSTTKPRKLASRGDPT